MPVCEPVPAPFPGGHGLSVRAQIVLGSCACAAGTAFLYAVDPNRHAVYPQCLLYRTTGIYCAGCGATRALYALLHGRVLEAARDNALLLIALPFVIAIGGAYIWQAWRGKAWPEWRFEPRAFARGGLWIFLTMLLFMAVRNLPGGAFDWLRPA